MTDPGPIRGEVVPFRRPEVIDTGASPWPDADDDEFDEWDHRRPLCDLIDGLLADMRDAAGQLDGLDGEAREVGRWLRGRVQHYVIKARGIR